MICPYCALGLHEECDADLILSATHLCCCDAEEDTEQQPQITSSNSILSDAFGVRKLKDRELVRDPTSTGRKEAARIRPIPIEGMICEWAGLAYAGGGSVPIVGCVDTFITSEKGVGKGAIHHGPDKDTLNNDVSNLHRICASCHNRWHTENDPFYAKDRPAFGQYIPLTGECKPHDPDTKASENQLKLSAKYWAMPFKMRAELNYREFVDFGEQHV